MSDIVLVALNARYSHPAFGLRYLKANLGPLEERCTLLERTLEARPLDVVEEVLALRPRVVGLSVYVWNARPMTELAALLKRLAPEVALVVGGPEVSHEIEAQPICATADYVVTDEGDLAFRALCEQLLAGRRPLLKVVAGGKPALDEVRFPYRLYDDEDVAQRTIYVEASRGCPFKCEFCLSSLDKTVRAFPQAAFLEELERLLARGVRTFKFVDRTFNLSLEASGAILRFFLERMRPGLFLHFEMIPDRLPQELRELLARFPPGQVQLEVGIQTFDDEVARRISRKQDAAKIEDNLRFLTSETGAHIHADLIAGLPGEDLDSFARGFDRLYALGPHEIQLGILKRLRGTPIARHDVEHGMVYDPHPPYEVLCTKALPFEELARVKRFARYWDLVQNSGRFPATTKLLLEGASPFAQFLAFSDWLFATTGGARHGIALARLAELLSRYLKEERRRTSEDVGAALVRDLGRDKAPTWALPPRQARHVTR